MIEDHPIIPLEMSCWRRPHHWVKALWDLPRSPNRSGFVACPNLAQRVSAPRSGEVIEPMLSDQWFVSTEAGLNSESAPWPVVKNGCVFFGIPVSFWVLKGQLHEKLIILVSFSLFFVCVCLF